MKKDEVERWDARYRLDDTPWDQGRASQTVLRVVERHLKSGARILVPGCGRGWEVEALGRLGFEVTGLDLSVTAATIGNSRLKNVDNATIQIGNFLAPPKAYFGYFDAVVEHTCFCAIEPSDRKQYRDAAFSVLTPGGVLLGAFLHFEGGGPPHGTNPDELNEVFGQHFVMIEMAAEKEPFAPKGCPQLSVAMKRREDPSSAI